MPADLLSKSMHKRLLPEERVVATAEFPAIYTFTCYVLMFSVAFMGGVMQYGLSRYGGVETYLPLGAGAALGFLLFLMMMMKMWTTEIVLTTRRLIYKRGFFAIRVEEVDTEQLASQQVEQTIVGRMLDYGEVHIRCIEASDVWLPPVSQPYDFINALERQKQTYRENYSKAVRARQHGVNPGDI
jgi:hypothetical protein